MKKHSLNIIFYFNLLKNRERKKCYLPNRSLNMLLVCAAMPFKSLLILLKKSRPISRRPARLSEATNCVLLESLRCNIPGGDGGECCVSLRP